MLQYLFFVLPYVYMWLQRNFKVLLLAWTVGIFGGLVLRFLRIVGLVKIEGYSSHKFIPDRDKGLLVIFRHPSLKEVMILPMMLFPAFLLHPEMVPVQTPDKYRYYDPWWMTPFRPVLIPVDRGNKMAAGRSLLEMRKGLRGGGVLLISPEGGRTFKAENVRFADGRMEEARGNVDVKQSVIRRFTDGVGILAKDETPVLPIWVEPHWKFGLRIVIGERFSCSTSLSIQEATSELEESMLRLAVR